MSYGHFPYAGHTIDLNLPKQVFVGAMSGDIAVNLPHHKSSKLCKTRTPYRQGNKLTSVKVYTVSKESQHLLIFNVPSFGLDKELLSHCKKLGKVKSFRLVSDYKKEGEHLEPFTCVFHVDYGHLRSGRFGKKKLDNYCFYGSVLHVCYAPELETVDETRAKLWQRRKEIISGLKMNPFTTEGANLKSSSMEELNIRDMSSGEPSSKTELKIQSVQCATSEPRNMLSTADKKTYHVPISSKRNYLELTSEKERGKKKFFHNPVKTNQSNKVPNALMFIPRSLQTKKN